MESNFFYARNGKVIKDLKDLKQALQDDEIDNQTFEYHHSNGHFSQWIQDVFNKEKLARDLKRVKQKKSFINKLEGANT